jgi:hypothetical protein
MELSVTEINERKREIDELAKLHNLEEWQKDRLFQEYVRRKSMGYEATLMEIAKEWGWLEEASVSAPLTEATPENKAGTLPNAVVEQAPIVEKSQNENDIDRFASEHQLTAVQKTALSQEYLSRKSRGKEVALLDLAKEIGIVNEQNETISTPEVASQETQKPVPQAQQTQQAATPQSVAPSQVQESQYKMDFDKWVGYKPSEGYVDPAKVAKMASEGPLEEASTWIATLVGRAAKKLGLWG